MIAKALADDGVRRLRETAIRSGGWGYQAGGQLFAAPTALGLLALAPRMPAAGPQSTEGSGVVESSLRALLSCQRPEGFFGTAPDDRVESWATAPAILALLAHGHRDRADSAAQALTRWEAPPERPDAEARKWSRDILKIDPEIRGWSWQAGESFATVEPTSLAIVALHAWNRPAGTSRITDGLRYLEDRVCASGGWNYGNPYFFESRLSPITLPTAKAVWALAVCGGQRHRALLSSGTTALKRLLADNPSRKANAWGTIAFATGHSPADSTNYAARAVDSGDGRGAWTGGPDEIALGVLAVRAATGDLPSCLGRVPA